MPSRRALQLIDYLLARQQQAPILEKRTRLPYGWALWLRALTPLPRPQHAREIVQVLLPRPLPASPGRLPELGRLRALRQLFWQGWDPPPRDQRWMRRASAFISALLHLLFFLGLLWIALISMPPPPSQSGQGDRVQVEFVGQGAQQGGGQTQPAEAAAQPAASDTVGGSSGQPASAAVAAPPAAAQAAASSEPVPVPPQPPVPSLEPATASPPPSPPVQATEVAEATHEFVVPAVSVPRTEVSVVPRTPVPQVRERSVQPVQAAPVSTVPVQALPVPERMAQLPQVQVREREVVPVPSVTAPSPLPMALPRTDVQLPQRELQVRERTVQTLPPVSAPAAQVVTAIEAPQLGRVQAPAVRERTVAEASPPAAEAAARPAPRSEASAATAAPRASAASSGPAPAARPAPDPGNWATPQRGDDWGAATRERAGTAGGSAAARAGAAGPGLFNADGSVRVPGEQGRGNSERGAPGGAHDGWSRERIAESGTWLKRPPYDYTPTSFDKYWVPNESLLAEWVRKGVKAIEIPLPGTGTRISCVISVLQFGGGCGLSDPNMQDQPAIARPPPDVPFKPEYQEGNGG